MTNLDYIKSLIRNIDEVDDRELTKAFRCPYTCADRDEDIPCIDAKPKDITDAICANCIRKWLRKQRYLG